MAQLLIRDVVILISSFGSAIAFPDFLHFVSAYIGDLRINLRARTSKVSLRNCARYLLLECASIFKTFFMSVIGLLQTRARLGR